MSDVLTIGEVAARSGVATSALRFYEEQGLIHSERNDSGHRRYPRACFGASPSSSSRRRSGCRSRRSAPSSRAAANRVPERADWAKLSGGWTKRIDARIAELERLEAGLTECIGCGCLSLDRCQLPIPAIAPRAAARGRATGSDRPVADAGTG